MLQICTQYTGLLATIHGITQGQKFGGIAAPPSMHLQYLSTALYISGCKSQAEEQGPMQPPSLLPGTLNYYIVHRQASYAEGHSL